MVTHARTHARTHTHTHTYLSSRGVACNHRLHVRWPRFAALATSKRLVRVRVRDINGANCVAPEQLRDVARPHRDFVRRLDEIIRNLLRHDAVVLVCRVRHDKVALPLRRGHDVTIRALDQKVEIAVAHRSGLGVAIDLIEVKLAERDEARKESALPGQDLHHGELRDRVWIGVDAARRSPR